MVSMSNIYLVGFMGAGKSSVAAALAARLGYDHLDLDERLCERFAASIPEIFENQGEEIFRRAESEELERSTCLRRHVVATGGGAFGTPSNREIILRSGGFSVFLNIPWEALGRRLARDHSKRPLFRDTEQARRLFEERLPHYLQAASTVSLIGDETPAEAADLVAGALRETPCAT
jgi:shikimate kinase